MKPLPWLIAVILIFLIIGVFFFRDRGASFLRHLPEKIDGWSVSEADRIYDAENLYEYIDGGAELYLSYGFKKAYCRIYSAPNQPDIFLDIFDMGESKNAYGVFAHSRETESHEFGMDSQYTSGLLLFWKGKYYVSILASPETEKSGEAVKLLARKVESLIRENGSRPDLLKFLPQDSLAKETIRYFRHYVWLNSFIFISNENILNFDKSTEALLAKYGVSGDGERSILLLIRYPNRKSLEKARQKFVENFYKPLAETPVCEKEGKWIGIAAHDNFLAIVLNSPSEVNASNLLNLTIEQIKLSVK